MRERSFHAEHLAVVWRLWCNLSMQACRFRVIFVRYVNYIIVCYHRRDMIKLCHVFAMLNYFPCVQAPDAANDMQCCIVIQIGIGNWKDKQRTHAKETKITCVWQIYYFVRVRLNCTNEYVRLERTEYEAEFGIYRQVICACIWDHCGISCDFF